MSHKLSLILSIFSYHAFLSYASHRLPMHWQAIELGSLRETIPQSYTRGVVDKQEVGFVRNVITIIELRKQFG